MPSTSKQDKKKSALPEDDLNHLIQEERRYRRVLRANSQNTDIRSQLGKRLLERGNPAEAQEQFERALAYNSHDADLLASLAEATSAQHKYQDSIESIQKMHELRSPEEWSVLALLDAIYHLEDAKKYQETLREHETLLSDDAKYHCLGCLYFMHGEHKQAIQHLLQAIQQPPVDPNTLHVLSTIYHRQKRWDWAREGYEKTIQLASDHLPSLLQLAKLYRERGMLIEAGEYLKRAERDHADDPLTLLEAAQQKFINNEQQSAKLNALAAISKNPQLTEAKRLLGKIDLQAGHYADACDYARACYERTNELQDFELLAEASYAGNGLHHLLRKWFHETLSPGFYFESGYRNGSCLAQLPPDSKAIGLDESPRLNHQLHANVTLHDISAYAYFQEHDLQQEFDGHTWDVAILGGSGNATEIIETLVQLLPMANEHSVVLIRNTCPPVAPPINIDKNEEAYCGNTWKAALAIAKAAPASCFQTFLCAPAGLTVVRSLQQFHKDHDFVNRIRQGIEQLEPLDMDSVPEIEQKLNAAPFSAQALPAQRLAE